jgi:hypothetical protein
MKSLRLAAAVAALSLTVLAGCATTRGEGDPLARVAVQSAVVIAVDRVVTRDNGTPAEVEARAARILLVVDSLKALGADALSTLPQINAALNPLLDRLNLSPLERQQANILISALVAVGLERTDASKYVAQVSWLLDEVARSASVYLPAASPVGSLRNGHDRLELIVLGDRRRLLPCS